MSSTVGQVAPFWRPICHSGYSLSWLSSIWSSHWCWHDGLNLLRWSRYRVIGLLNKYSVNHRGLFEQHFQYHYCSLTLKQVGHYCQNVILVFFVVWRLCDIFVWIMVGTIDTKSALWILMPWCFSTKTSAVQQSQCRLCTHAFPAINGLMKILSWIPREQGPQHEQTLCWPLGDT